MTLRALLAATVMVAATVPHGLNPAVALAQGFGGFVSPGPLAEPHAELDNILKCTSCHAPGAGVTPARCMECHERVQQQVASGTGFHAGKGEACAGCHADHEGRDFAMVQFSEETFNHQAVGFALTGEHAGIACEDCHKEPGRWDGLTSECASCHEEPHGAEVSTRDLLDDCRTCHDAASWEPIPRFSTVFDHQNPAHADFALQGLHADVACADCHQDARFVPTPAEACSTCHEDIHGRQFAGRACDDCHDQTTPKFRIRDYDHARTDFPLTGEHREVACEDCHGDGRAAIYTPVAHARCGDCHDDVHDGQFAPRTCDDCHSPRLADWAVLDFDHDAVFPLLRAHRDVACEDCHGEGEGAVFAGLPSADCSGCHDDAHEDRFAPTPCVDCHLDATWAMTSDDPPESREFDHGRTKYALHGAHSDVPCAGCHGEGDAKVLFPVEHDDCLDCHEEPHEGTLGASTCDGCHVVDTWAASIHDHLESTGFPLDGEHADLACDECHRPTSGRPGEPGFAIRFDREEAACASCHADDEPPDHFEGECGSCHATSGWAGAGLGEHGHDSTGFPLRGSHTTLGCADCHSEGDSGAVASPACGSCHVADDAHHGLLGAACDDCHRDTEWTRVRFDHGLTGWPLHGGHKLAACEDCHATGYGASPTRCTDCHFAERPSDSLHNDPMVASACDVCHRPSAWEATTYPHGDFR